MEMDLLWYMGLQPDQGRSWVDVQLYYDDMNNRLSKQENANTGGKGMGLG